jgi:amidase
MTDLPFRSARQLAAAIRSRKTSAAELLEVYVERTRRLNPRLNAIIFTNIDAARKQARAADSALKRGKKPGPLHGVPMTVKESYDVAGMPTTWGQPQLKDNIAKENALAVTRLQQAGAVIFGKTNVPLNLADWQSFNAVYGTTNNPWDVSRTPGGSSGGSAAALAAGLHSKPRPLLRCVRPQAHVAHRFTQGASAAGKGCGIRYCGDWPDGAFRRRSRNRFGRNGRIG